MKKKSVVISGCGIAGCFLAILLLKKEYKVTIFEKLSEKDSISAASNRSYNITFFGYGLSLLKELNLWKEILPFSTKLIGSATYLSKSKNPIISKREKGSSPYFAVSRADILTVLLKKIKDMNCKIYFETPITSINKKQKTISFKNSQKGTIEKIKFDLIVGCDGVNSIVREALLTNSGSKIVKVISDWTYKQFRINSEKAQELEMKFNYAHTWSDKKFAIVAFPNKDKSHTAILITKMDNAIESDYIFSRFPNLKKLDNEFNALKKERSGRFSTLHTSPWFYKDFIVIIGDAAHGFNPFFGQGVSAAMGDAYELSNFIDQENGLLKFQKSRKIHMDALGELSKKGFKRYRRDKRADYNTVYEKLESILYSKFPKFFVKPVFDSITFDPGGTNNYLKAHQRQRKIMALLGFPIVVKFITWAFSTIESRP